MGSHCPCPSEHGWLHTSSGCLWGTDPTKKADAWHHNGEWRGTSSKGTNASLHKKLHQERPAPTSLPACLIISLQVRTFLPHPCPHSAQKCWVTSTTLYIYLSSECKWQQSECPMQAWPLCLHKPTPSSPLRWVFQHHLTRNPSLTSPSPIRQVFPYVLVTSGQFLHDLSKSTIVYLCAYLIVCLPTRKQASSALLTTISPVPSLMPTTQLGLNNQILNKSI